MTTRKSGNWVHGEASGRKNGTGKCSPELEAWYHMKGRCYNENNGKYRVYGGRGIAVCDRWLESFQNFLDDMGRRPSPAHSLDRKDPDGDYCKSNCRWATQLEQQNNRRDTRRLNVYGVDMTIQEASAKWGIHKETIYNRLVHGWTDERAATQPVDISKRSSTYKRGDKNVR